MAARPRPPTERVAQYRARIPTGGLPAAVTSVNLTLQRDSVLLTGYQRMRICGGEWRRAG
jgi:hypothetical protein